MSGATASAPMEGKTLAAQEKNAPGVYQMNSTYAPLYSELNEEDLMNMLNGSGNSPGLLSEYSNEIMPTLTAAQTQSNTAIRGANINDAANLGPAYTQAEAAADPMAAGLLTQVGSSASNELSYGTQLTPAEQVQMNQSVRGGQAARGMGFSPSDVFGESLADTGFGQNLLQQRQGTAQSAAGSLQSFYGNPTAAISGMGYGGGASASQIAGMGAGLDTPVQSSEFNPESSVNSLMMGEQFQGAEQEDQDYNQGILSSISSGESISSGSGGSSLGGGL